MIAGRYSMRGRVFQPRVFAPRALANSVLVLKYGRQVAGQVYQSRALAGQVYQSNITAGQVQ